MKLKPFFFLLLCSSGLFAQTATVTVNQSTKVTQPPVGTFVLSGASNYFLTTGVGTPEGSVTATPGSLFLDRNGILWLKGSGSGNTGWTNVATGGVVNPSALTRTNDTNVTLTLGGSPSTALLQASSITVGWSGTLAKTRGGFGADISSESAHTFFANNTGSTGAPSFTSFVAKTDYWDTTNFVGSDGTTAQGLVPPVPMSAPPCVRFLSEAAPYWECVGGGGTSGGAPDDAYYVTTQSNATLSNEFNLGSLSSGILKQTVSGSVSTPAIAASGDIIGLFTGCSGTQYLGADGACHSASAAQNHSVTFVVDGAGIVLGTGTKNPVKIPFGGTLTGWLLIGKPSGSVTVDIFRAADGAGLPVTSIVGSGTKPALSSAVENSSTSFTSWTSTTLTAKDNLAVSLSGISASTYVALTLYYQ